jgi:hypothetical protein
MTLRLGYRALRWASVAALLSLVLMAWGVLVPSPLSLVVAMTVGQALGTLSFAVYWMVVINDLRNSRVFSTLRTRLSSLPPPPSTRPPTSKGPPPPSDR